jgi:hypothetical protein
MRGGLLGQIVTPAAGNRLLDGVDWIADNSIFGDKYPGDAEYLGWLDRYADRADRCAFAVAPDVVCDADATLARSLPLLAPIRARAGRVAYVAQNGATADSLPWHLFDVLFLGGDTEWKLGPAARALVDAARRLGRAVHMGRVNSLRRLRYADAIGCHTADGTYLAFGPTRNLPSLLAWLRDVEQPTLWEMTA